MILLKDILHLPMVTSLIIPLGGVALLVIFLLWESRLPPEKKTINRLKNRKNRPVQHKWH